MSSTFKPYPLATQHQFKTNVVTLLDNVISQITCFDDQVLTFESQSGQCFELIEQSPESEDTEVLFSALEIRNGIKLSSLEEALRHKASDALGDSLVLFDCEVGETWSLTFDADGEKVIVLDSSEVTGVK